MGNKVAVFTEQQLDEYQACTYLTRKNILRAERLFRGVCGSALPTRLDPITASTVTAPYQALDTLTELKENPFRRRMCQVFSGDGSASLTFEQFIELFSVFSDHAPRDIRATKTHAPLPILLFLTPPPFPLSHALSLIPTPSTPLHALHPPPTPSTPLPRPPLPSHSLLLTSYATSDFDDDGYLGEEDLQQTVKHLTHDLLTQDEYSTIVSKVLEEADVDCDTKLSQSEFIHVILKSPDFLSNFHIRI
ncbi:hypothetical protein Pcinc_043679 [Petrolisthes cinctipes]|uniref:EF-hand domain-containing protein n=1 Tax=Petrolisthes cinctipes TaxID=88211 RepID=A0AAE1BFI0_PETCI|nr:hypothetical protein Pcinc_043679 [Petrolisthes cinctipes]